MRPQAGAKFWMFSSLTIEKCHEEMVLEPLQRCPTAVSRKSLDSDAAPMLIAFYTNFCSSQIETQP
jgi:hypothetical protein